MREKNQCLNDRICHRNVVNKETDLFTAVKTEM